MIADHGSNSVFRRSGMHESARAVKILPFDLIRVLIRLIGRISMKGVWFLVCAAVLAIVGVVTVAPSIAQAAGLTRAQVLADIVGQHADPLPVQSAPLQSSLLPPSAVARPTAL